MHSFQLKGLFLMGLLSLFAAQSFTQTITYYQTGEEFNGPYASWKNIKTDFSAKGDGVTDDAANINSALISFKNISTTTSSVLYFPAGTYVINSTIANSGRTLGDDYAGLIVIGENPATRSQQLYAKLSFWMLRTSTLPRLPMVW